jgi:lipooligosaccharide transport system permease protein
VTTQPSALPVIEHLLVGIRRTWRGQVLSSFVLPVLMLLGMGVTVGRYVNRAGALGVPYLDYIAPGLLASSAVQIAVAESMWPVMSGFMWNRVFHGMLATPIRPADMVRGESMFLQLRTGLPAASFLLVMLVFGAVHSPWAIAALPACALLTASLTGVILAYTASVTSDNMFALLFRFAVIPMTLFAGVFFPVSAMPAVARWIAYVSPLWHGVELCRYATLGRPSALPVVAHVAYLGAWAVAGYALAQRRFAKRLGD